LGGFQRRKSWINKEKKPFICATRGKRERSRSFDLVHEGKEGELSSGVSKSKKSLLWSRGRGKKRAHFFGVERKGGKGL